MTKNHWSTKDPSDEIDVDIYDGKSSPGELYINDNVGSGKGKNDGVSFFKKFCFAIAGMSFQLHFCAIGVFASVFLLNRAKIPADKNM